MKNNLENPKTFHWQPHALHFIVWIVVGFCTLMLAGFNQFILAEILWVLFCSYTVICFWKYNIKTNIPLLIIHLLPFLGSFLVIISQGAIPPLFVFVGSILISSPNTLVCTALLDVYSSNQLKTYQIIALVLQSIVFLTPLVKLIAKKTKR